MGKKYDYRKENLLIVDNEIEIGKGLRDSLSNLGFNTDFVSNGKNALQELRNKKYTFLITDINMPAVKGIELIKTVK